jgi:hypothetical protein
MLEKNRGIKTANRFLENVTEFVYISDSEPVKLKITGTFTRNLKMDQDWGMLGNIIFGNIFPSRVQKPKD